MSPDSSIGRRPKTLHEVTKKYGHPWPWRSGRLIGEHGVERDVNLQELVERWGVTEKVPHRWVRRHGYRVENLRAKR